MKLKNILALALFATAFTACETVDEDERFIGPVEFTPKKNVLIEDFTGQRCINCPNATKAVHSLQNTYGKDHIIAVAIHGGQLSLPAPAGLATTESQAYNTKWGVDSWPKGMVNRKGGLFEFSSWSAKVVEELQKEPGVQLNMENNAYNEESQKLTVTVDVTANQTSSATLQVWLIENGIIAYQVMPDGTHNTQYQHDHVFRAAVNGLDGENIELSKGETLTKQYEYTISDNTWKPENMAVVSFVADANGVLQVIEAPILK